MSSSPLKIHLHSRYPFHLSKNGQIKDNKNYFFKKERKKDTIHCFFPLSETRNCVRISDTMSVKKTMNVSV